MPNQSHTILSRQVATEPAYVRFKAMMQRGQDGVWYSPRQIGSILQSGAFKEFAALFPKSSGEASTPPLAVKESPSRNAKQPGESTASAGGQKP